jgi:hypothetical protein
VREGCSGKPRRVKRERCALGKRDASLPNWGIKKTLFPAAIGPPVCSATPASRCQWLPLQFRLLSCTRSADGTLLRADCSGSPVSHLSHCRASLASPAVRGHDHPKSALQHRLAATGSASHNPPEDWPRSTTHRNSWNIEPSDRSHGIARGSSPRAWLAAHGRSGSGRDHALICTKADPVSRSGSIAGS